MFKPAQIVRCKRALKAKAVALNIVIPRGFNFIPFVGPFTRELIRRVEKHEWPNLPPTGEFNSRMLALLFPAPPLTIGAVALSHAKRELGVKEDPASSNAGPRVSQYEAILGLNHQPWCACFITWCLRQAGWNRKGWNQAYVPSWVGEAHNGQGGLLVIGPGAVAAGDLACFDWQHDGIADHIEFASGPVVKGQFPTIGGNTSSSAAGDKSNGGEVAANTRSVSDVAAFIRVL
jgi:hypothetical protein